MKKIVLGLCLVFNLGQHYMIAQEQEQHIYVVVDEDVFADDQAVYDEFDTLADNDVYQESQKMLVDYMPGWLRSFGLRLLMSYIAVKSFFSEKWTTFKRKLAVVYAATFMKKHEQA